MDDILELIRSTTEIERADCGLLMEIICIQNIKTEEEHRFCIGQYENTTYLLCILSRWNKKKVGGFDPGKFATRIVNSALDHSIMASPQKWMINRPKKFIYFTSH